jgi:hypothetical protein
VVASCAVSVCQKQGPIGGDGDHAALLQWVSRHAALPVAIATGPQTARNHFQGRKTPKSAVHFHCFVRGFFGVREHPFEPRVVLGKVLQVVNGAISDDRQAVAGAVNGFFGFDVVSDLLTAKQSTEVPNEGDHGGLFRPQAFEPYGVSILVKNGEGWRVSHG